MLKKELQELRTEVLSLCQEIEKFPASEHQTATVLLASGMLKKVDLCIDLAQVPEND